MRPIPQLDGVIKMQRKSENRDTTVSRNFTISSSAGVGTYDLLVAIWKDTNGNYQIDGDDLVLRTGRFDNVLYVY